MSRRWILFGVLACFPSSFLWAESPGKYLAGAKLTLSTGGWTDIWLNGHFVVDHAPRTLPEKGPATFRGIESHLCYFQRENVLALEVTAPGPGAPPNPLGIAYVLELTFSDGTRETFSSGDPDRPRAFYIGDEMAGNPPGWEKAEYDDSGWSGARNAVGSLPGAASLTKAGTLDPAGFLSAAPFPGVRPGERHLLRARFPLDIAANPNCGKLEGSKGVVPRRVQAKVPAPPAPVLLVPTPTPESIETPVLAPSVSLTPTPLPQGTPTPASALLPPPAPIFTPRVEMRRTPGPSTPVFPTPTARVLPSISPRIEPGWKPSPTPLPVKVNFAQVPDRAVANPRPSPIPTATSVPLRVARYPLAAVPTIRPVFTPAPRETAVLAAVHPKGPSSAPQTLMFAVLPFNLYVNFSDGPGRYRVEVQDRAGGHLKTLFEKRVGEGAEKWLEWDGKDEQGTDVPLGQYGVVCSKDGKILRRIVLIRTAAGR